MKLFCDTSFFVAIYDATDQYHETVLTTLKSLNQLSPQIMTSDYIYSETVTFLLMMHPYYGYIRAKNFEKDSQKLKFVMVYITEPYFIKAKEIFFRYNKDKRWSFTDCTSFAVMEDYGIRNVLTFDENFRQMGFKILKP